jgi:hypothetical protein
VEPQCPGEVLVHKLHAQAKQVDRQRIKLPSLYCFKILTSGKAVEICAPKNHLPSQKLIADYLEKKASQTHGAAASGSSNSN